MPALAVITCETPLGLLAISGTEKGIRALRFVDATVATLPASIVAECARQLAAYFRGDCTAFTDLPLAMEGTQFQASVWSAALAIPFGETRTYRDLAVAIGQPNAARAVGTALSRNPLPILVPCHRIVPAAGGIGAYSAGAWRKAWLLEHEKKPSV